MSEKPETHAAGDCGGCGGARETTPAEIFNEPGLQAIGYRIGTHARVKESMMVNLTWSDQPALQNLTTRSDEFFSIALLDAWAMIGDVLTFYQERIANESYLRTATEPESVYQLARLVGYKLYRGVAAETDLAFTIDNAPGSPPKITIGRGVKVQSIPGPNEKPQVFETVEQIEARVEWNAIRPRLKRPQEISTFIEHLILAGTTTNLKSGDYLLIVTEAGERAARIIKDVRVDKLAKTTCVELEFEPELAPDPKESLPKKLPQVRAKGSPTDFPADTPLEAKVLDQIIGKDWSEGDLVALAKAQNWPIDLLAAKITERAKTLRAKSESGIYAFRQRAAIFGHNAPHWGSLPASVRYGSRKWWFYLVWLSGFIALLLLFVWVAQLHFPMSDLSIGYLLLGAIGLIAIVGWWRSARICNWEGRKLKQDQHSKAEIHLDGANLRIAPQSWTILQSPEVSPPTSYKVIKSAEVTLDDFAISARVTQLELGDDANLDRYSVRNTTAWVQSERLELAEAPIENEEIAGSITLDSVCLGLQPGRRIVLSGERNDVNGITACKIGTLKEATIKEGFTVLAFKESLASVYKRATLALNANVVHATHGESVSEEILGSGSGCRKHQRFTLQPSSDR